MKSTDPVPLGRGHFPEVVQDEYVFSMGWGLLYEQAQICAKRCEGEQLLKCFFLVDFSDQITEQAGPELGQVQYKPWG